MSLVQPVPKPTWKRRHAVTSFPVEVAHTIYKRAGGLCEGKDCPNRRGDWRGLALAHRFREGMRNKGMGGSHRVPMVDDGWLACYHCHNLEDHHQTEAA